MKTTRAWFVCAASLALLLACRESNDGSESTGGHAVADAGATGGQGGAGAMPAQMGNGPGGKGGGPGDGGSAGKTATGGDATGGRGDATGGRTGGARGGAGGSAQGGSAGGAKGSATGGAAGGNAETGRLAGITAAHNAVRAAVQATTALPPLVWSETLAQYAQQWADSLAATSCTSPHHRTGQELQAVGYGENLAAFISSSGGSTAQQAVNGWAGEKACYTFGTFMSGDKCDTACYTNLHSDGCGHYTQIVWRTSTEVGCGVATCQNGSGKEDIWICNYKPPGNYVGRNPY